MCVYKGVTGLVKKLTPQAGTRWPEYFGIKPKPIWCGMTILEYSNYRHMGAYLFYSPQKKYVVAIGDTWQESCATAWSFLATAGWGGDWCNCCQAWIEIRKTGTPPYTTEITERRFQIGIRFDSWYYYNPGVHPDRIRITMGVANPQWFAGDAEIPDLDWSAPLRTSSVVCEKDISGMSLGTGIWRTWLRILESSKGFCCDPGPVRCSKNANISSYTYASYEIWGGASGWEYIEIPDWIFESPGKYWLAMVDAEGNMLPGPYLPLN